jgi:uncharacterized membrane protein
MKAERKKIKKEKIKKAVTTGAGVVAGVVVGVLVREPVAATATGLGVAAATIQLIDVARDICHRNS